MAIGRKIIYTLLALLLIGGCDTATVHENQKSSTGDLSQTIPEHGTDRREERTLEQRRLEQERIERERVERIERERVERIEQERIERERIERELEEEEQRLLLLRQQDPRYVYDEAKRVGSLSSAVKVAYDSVITDQIKATTLAGFGAGEQGFIHLLAKRPTSAETSAMLDHFLTALGNNAAEAQVARLNDQNRSALQILTGEREPGDNEDLRKVMIARLVKSGVAEDVTKIKKSNALDILLDAVTEKGALGELIKSFQGINATRFRDFGRWAYLNRSRSVLDRNDAPWTVGDLFRSRVRPHADNEEGKAMASGFIEQAVFSHGIGDINNGAVAAITLLPKDVLTKTHYKLFDGTLFYVYGNNNTLAYEILAARAALKAGADPWNSIQAAQSIVILMGSPSEQVRNISLNNEQKRTAMANALTVQEISALAQAFKLKLTPEVWGYMCNARIVDGRRKLWELLKFTVGGGALIQNENTAAGANYLDYTIAN